MSRDDGKMQALKLRGDGALAVLQAVSASLLKLSHTILELHETCEKVIASTNEFDIQAGLSVGKRADPKSEMLAVLRKQMPHLSNLSDEEIIKQFGG